MVTKLTLLLILASLHRGYNSPLRQLKQLKHPNEIVPILVPAHHATFTILPRNLPTHQSTLTVHPQTVPQETITVLPTNVQHGSLTVHSQTVPTQQGTITVHPQNIPTHQGTLTLHAQIGPQRTITVLPTSIQQGAPIVHPQNTQIQQSTLTVSPQNVPSHQATLTINPHTVPTQQNALTAHPQNAILTSRQKKGPSFISFPITQYLIPKFHVIPAQSNVHHSSVHTDNYNIQTVSHTASNITHPSLIPVLIPIHHNLVSVQDLSVIPLQKNVHSQKLGHFRVMEKMDEADEEQVNRFRTFYGGYGTGLFFGGHGAGHGFHIFG